MRTAAALNKIKMLHEIPPRPIDPNSVIAELEKLFRDVVGDQVSFRTSLDPRLGRISADRKILQRVLVNLMVDTFRAMLVQTVVIATSNVKLDHRSASEMNLSPGPYVQIELGVRRTEVDAQPAIRNIVHQAHGAVWVRDAGTEGVNVTILLPRFNPAPQRGTAL